jgi:hypothetical protein
MSSLPIALSEDFKLRDRLRRGVRAVTYVTAAPGFLIYAREIRYATRAMFGASIVAAIAWGILHFG